ncbi:hypothetical protein SUGI_0081910 [Cryptomeria japonica]|nr:hypothetical protein SUGI_0081910 [Cryptomeria japonica]
MKNDHNYVFAGFESHTKGIGMNMLTKMVYREKGLGVSEQGMSNYIEVKERPCYQGLAYGQIGESSKAFRKENLLVKTSNYISGSESLSSPKKKVKRQDKAHNYCTHYRISGNWMKKCWKLHPKVLMVTYVHGGTQQGGCRGRSRTRGRETSTKLGRAASKGNLF